MAKITLHEKSTEKQIKYWKTKNPVLFPQINTVKNSPHCRWALVNYAAQQPHIRFSVQEYTEANTWRQVQLPWMLEKQSFLAEQEERCILNCNWQFLYFEGALKVWETLRDFEHHLPSFYWEERLLNNLLEPVFFFRRSDENSMTGITCGSNWKLPQRGLSTEMKWKNWRGWYSHIVQHLALLAFVMPNSLMQLIKSTFLESGSWLCSEVLGFHL